MLSACSLGGVPVFKRPSLKCFFKLSESVSQLFSSRRPPVDWVFPVCMMAFRKVPVVMITAFASSGPALLCMPRM